jgi:ribonuclease HI
MGFIVYTDGASSPKQEHKVGGWAYVLMHEAVGGEIEDSGYEVDTTNNRMELRSIIEALEFVRQLGTPKRGEGKVDVTIYSDSQYCVKGCTEWLKGWKRTNWKNNSVKNVDMWKKLDTLVSDDTLNVKFEWVRGHNGDTLNERVDKLCVEAKEKGIEMVNTE